MCRGGDIFAVDVEELGIKQLRMKMGLGSIDPVAILLSHIVCELALSQPEGYRDFMKMKGLLRT